MPKTRRALVPAAFVIAAATCSETGVEPPGWKQVASYASHVCAISLRGGTWCWVNSTYTFFPGLEPGPMTVVPLSDAFDRVFVGGNHACALNAVGTAWCWGSNMGGQLGVGTTSDRTQPHGPIAGDYTFTTLSLGMEHTCGLTTAGDAFCWGWNKVGQLGDSTPAFFRTTPTPVAGGQKFVQLASGDWHTCGMRADRSVYCWGAFNEYLSEPVRLNYRSVPKLVPGAIQFTSIGGSGICGLTSAGEAYCWSYQRQSDGSTIWTEPTRRGDLTFSYLAARGHSALEAEGRAYRLFPFELEREAEAYRFVAYDYVCGLTREREIYCRKALPFGAYTYEVAPPPS